MKSASQPSIAIVIILPNIFLERVRTTIRKVCFAFVNAPYSM